MNALAAGDRVLVANGKFSEVLLFTHSDPYTRAKFIELELDSGLRVSLTPGHYVFADGKAIRAEDVKVGSRLTSRTLKNGVWQMVPDRVAHSRSTVERGLFNPQTASGDIVVNGILTTCYTEAVIPMVAHALLAPVRGLAQAKAEWIGGYVRSGVELVSGWVTR